MCKNFVEHFKKYNQFYSFGLLLIITLVVVFLFIKVDSLETDIDKQVNEPNINHQLTLDQLKVEPETATIKTEVTVSPETVAGQEMPGVTVPGQVVPGETPPNGEVVPNGAPTPDNSDPRNRMLPPNMVRP